jgi:hypothetical protein
MKLKDFIKELSSISEDCKEWEVGYFEKNGDITVIKRIIPVGNEQVVTFLD